MMNRYSIKNDVYPLVKLAVPLALTGLVQSATWFCETMFLAHVNEETLAAGALVSWLFATLAVILFGTMSSINILVAHKHGEKDVEGIEQVSHDGILLAILITVPFIILFWNMSPIFQFFGQPERVSELARLYLHALSWGLLANFISIACLEVFIGLGHTRFIFGFSIIETVLNIACSYTLIFGKFGFPALGIAGAGWGLTFSYIGKLLILSLYIAMHKEYRKYFRHTFSFTATVYLFELLKVGVPMGLMFSVEVAFFFALTLAMGLLGADMMAANQVTVQYLGLMMSMIFTVAQAITVRMGHLLGAQKIDAAKKAGEVGVLMAAAFMCLIAIIYWVKPLPLISLAFDVNNPAKTNIVDAIKSFLAIAAIFQIVEAARIALFGVLRSLKDTRFTLLTSIISFWCIALPGGYFLAMKLHFGGNGYWWAMVMGAGVSVMLLQWRFSKKISRYLTLHSSMT
ncbi:MAG TPA: MATE family efflux transporter [Gammaproteobacteria bacterium]|nr:MATE family efflux transporter [Gammaproteobacteria bacterium]